MDLAARRAALGSVRRWAPVIGAFELPALDGHELVVIDALPDASGADDAARARLGVARATGALVIAYLSVGTVEDWRAHARGVPDAWTLGPMPGWPGERYADARQEGWRTRLVAEARALAARGVDGLFLDNLDVGELHPGTQDALVALVAELRAAVGELLLIAQNGLAIVERLPVDAISREDTWWRHDGGGYAPSHVSDTAEILHGIRRQRDRGLTVLTLDYTEPGDPAADDVVRRSRAEGFVPAVSVLELDRAPHAPRAA